VAIKAAIEAAIEVALQVAIKVTQVSTTVSQPSFPLLTRNQSPTTTNAKPTNQAKVIKSSKRMTLATKAIEDINSTTLKLQDRTQNLNMLCPTSIGVEFTIDCVTSAVMVR
jgi:hypothetical protein